MKLLLSLRDISLSATKSRGISNVALGLCWGLMRCPELKELHVLSNRECSAHLQAQAPLPPHVTLHGGDNPPPRGWKRILWDQWGVQRAISQIKPDWVLLPKGFPPYFPALGRSKLACYLHDINWEYYQKRGGEQKATGSPYPKAELFYFSRLARRALKRSHLILCSTQFNKGAYQKQCPSCQPAVVGIGFDAPEQRRSKAQGQDVLAYCSAFPHKRSELLLHHLKAWLAQRADAAQIRIQLLGTLPPHCDIPTGRQWLHHLGLPHAAMIDLLLKQCRATVYMSDYEGYGMPPVENLRMGIACIASDIPAIRENIPPHYLFQNQREEQFIRRLNQAYDEGITTPIPPYPSWQDVAKKVIAAMQGKEKF